MACSGAKIIGNQHGLQSDGADRGGQGAPSKFWINENKWFLNKTHTIKVLRQFFWIVTSVLGSMQGSLNGTDNDINK